MADEQPRVTDAEVTETLQRRFGAMAFENTVLSLTVEKLEAENAELRAKLERPPAFSQGEVRK